MPVLLLENDPSRSLQIIHQNEIGLDDCIGLLRIGVVSIEFKYLSLEYVAVFCRATRLNNRAEKT